MVEEPSTFAPGWPGIPGRWTSSAKSGVGTAVSRDSRVWFTLSHGILNEVYYPRVDHACTATSGSSSPMARRSSRKKSGIPARRRRKWLLAFRPIGFATPTLTAAIGSRRRC